MTKFSQAVKTKDFWTGIAAYGLIQPPYIFLCVDYAYYLKEYSMSETATSINTSFVIGIGIIGGILVNFSSKVNFMTILLYFIMATGMTLISLSTILVRAKYFISNNNEANLESLILFIGETMFGIGIIGNMSFVTMSFITAFPKMDYCKLLSGPQMLGTL